YGIVDRCLNALSIVLLNTSSAASRICDAISLTNETCWSELQTQMPSLILPRISARLGEEYIGPRTIGQVIRIWQFECAILLDFMKWKNKLRLRWREIQMITRGMASTKHVLLAHIVPTRRCNLACGYCNEYD